MYPKEPTAAEQHAAGIAAGLAFLNSDEAPASFTYECRAKDRPATVDGALGLHEAVWGAANYRSEYARERVLVDVVATSRTMGWRRVGAPKRTGHNSIRITFANPRLPAAVAN